MDLPLRQKTCRHCSCLFAICTACDRGHAYCTPRCRAAARRRSVQAARARHQRSPEGRLDHRDRQRVYRDRRRVMDQSSTATVGSYYQYGRRTVHLDGCVEVASAYYSAPPGWIGRRVDVQWDAVHVRLLDPRTGQLLGEHLRAPRGWHRIADQDRPARTPPKTLALLAAAKRAGPGVATLCDHIHRHDGAAGVRRILGVLALAKKHGPVVVEQAAAAALELGMPTYRFVKRYLDRRPAPPLSLRQVDPLIRQLTL